MSTAITTQPKRTLAIYDSPLPMRIVKALETGNKLRGFQRSFYGRPDRKGMAPVVLPLRDKWLEQFADADLAAGALERISWAGIDRNLAIDMLTTLYRSLGAKPDDGSLAAAIDMFESDALGVASGLWRPMNVTPAMLALACRSLINTCIFPPKPAELRNACREADRAIGYACAAATNFREQVVEVDALLLMQAHDDWERPYLTERYRPILERMLYLHFCSDFYDDKYSDDPPFHPFVVAVDQERAKLALRAPQPEPKTPPLRVQPERRKATDARNPARQVRADVVVEPPKGELTS
jgi:hypothetical protein